ncbi:MAG: hypothetical protein CM1200mP29_17680 [Verrucomicrobiota bacterium]|nr:MAG: hypothetical protein CM1200mP29_17680 [Verrucomicrobiota bacterium]
MLLATKAWATGLRVDDCRPAPSLPHRPPQAVTGLAMLPHFIMPLGQLLRYYLFGMNCTHEGPFGPVGC